MKKIKLIALALCGGSLLINDIVVAELSSNDVIKTYFSSTGFTVGGMQMVTKGSNAHTFFKRIFDKLPSKIWQIYDTRTFYDKDQKPVSVFRQDYRQVALSSASSLTSLNTNCLFIRKYNGKTRRMEYVLTNPWALGPHLNGEHWDDGNLNEQKGNSTKIHYTDREPGETLVSSVDNTTRSIIKSLKEQFDSDEDIVIRVKGKENSSNDGGVLCCYIELKKKAIPNVSIKCRNKETNKYEPAPINSVFVIIDNKFNVRTLFPSDRDISLRDDLYVDQTQELESMRFASPIFPAMLQPAVLSNKSFDIYKGKTSHKKYVKMKRSSSKRTALLSKPPQFTNIALGEAMKESLLQCWCIDPFPGVFWASASGCQRRFQYKNHQYKVRARPFFSKSKK